MFSLILLATLLIACSEDENNTETENNDESGIGAEISLDEVSGGEGAFNISDDIEMKGSGQASHYFDMAQTGDVSWAIHAVEIEDTENEVTVRINFFIKAPEADMFGGKAPGSGTYSLYEPGLSTPEENYAKVNVYGDGLDSYFTTDEESELQLTVDNDDNWEASFSNVLDDYETEEMITLQCAFKADARD